MCAQAHSPDVQTAPPLPHRASVMMSAFAIVASFPRSSETQVSSALRTLEMCLLLRGTGYHSSAATPVPEMDDSGLSSLSQMAESSRLKAFSCGTVWAGVENTSLAVQGYLMLK